VLSTIKDVMEGSAVVLTVNGSRQLIAMEDFASWTAVQFAKLYTVSFAWTCTCRSLMYKHMMQH